MKFLTALLVLTLLPPTVHATNECRDADGNAIAQTQCAETADAVTVTDTASGLPDDAIAKVKDLEIQRRYFRSIGLHRHSKQQRDAIIAIYAAHDVPLPAEYRD